MDPGSINIDKRITTYYRGERISNALLAGIGFVAAVTTFLLYIWRQGHLSTGLFFSACPFAVFYVITGGYRFWRSLKRYQLLASDDEKRKYLFEDETPHLEGRMVRFGRKRKADLTGIIIGFMIIFSTISFNWNHVFIGTAFNITFFSAILLAFDLLGQFRTEELLYHIGKMKKSGTV
jgi:hypothetical protein